ncbi:hypothetical protein BJ912DRAFT_227957 [Pholiota molesta]|nr:hypothetical protein BJ912DRAFT_227957 [Pholiota molesta]
MLTHAIFVNAVFILCLPSSSPSCPISAISTRHPHPNSINASQALTPFEPYWNGWKVKLIPPWLDPRHCVFRSRRVASCML